MKKTKYLILLVLLIPFSSFAQFGEPCLPDGISFSSQAKIDSFPINYPNCTKILGNVSITGSDIKNLFGLNAIIEFDDTLSIGWTDSLINLSGLENVVSIGGSLRLVQNEGILTLAGLEKCSFIGSDLILGIYHFWDYYYGNRNLSSISALENLDSIGGNVEIIGNHKLKNLIGLDSIKMIKGNLIIGGNDSLNNLTGLENLTVIDSNLHIGVKVHNAGGNKFLEDFTGLNNLRLIRGDLRVIDEDSLKSFNGLNNLNVIEGDFIVGDQLYDAGDNPSLVNFQGLDKLDSIGGAVIIKNNPALLNLTGLDSIKTIGGGVTIESNNSLINISSLNSLQYLFGSLNIEENNAIISLSGLDNINGDSLDYLIIKWNPNLSECAVQGICDYLASHVWGGTIWGNDTGCISRVEVEQICGTVYMEDYSPTNQLSIYPNPFTNSTTISYDFPQISTVQISIFNHFGQQVDFIQRTQAQGKQQIIWDASGQPSGVYYFRLEAGGQVATGKLLLVR